MDNRIYIKDWLEFKPYKKQTATDYFYIKICNEVKTAILADKHSFVLQEHIDSKGIDLLACFLTSYLEDLISETNIWNTFIKIHKRLYKKQLPFYILDDYYEEEINPQDISFLIWYFLNTVQEVKYISPFNDFIVETADTIMEVLDNAWEQAPENKHLKSFYQVNENEEDFYMARNLIDTILFKTYLFYPDTFLKLRKREHELIAETENEEHLVMFLNDNRDSTLSKIHTRLLCLMGKEWASEIVGNNHALSAQYLNISQRISGYFLYKGQDAKDLFIEHIASGKKFKLTKKSFDHSRTLKELDTIMFLGIAQWKDEWWFSGVYFQIPFDPDIILDEKNSIESRMTVNFLDHQTKETSDILGEQLKAFLDFNNGSQIAFLSSDKIGDFVTGYNDYYNNSLQLSASEKEEAKQRARNEGFFGTEEKKVDYSRGFESGLVFFNPKSGVEIAWEVNSAFPLPNNPFFNADHCEDDIMSVMISDEMSTELALFCINLSKNKLPVFKKGIGKRYLKDIDFLLRFWKKENYFAKPSITFTGQEEN